MLERVPLKAPWNMFHTERMMDWAPERAALHGPWLATLEVIGRQGGRPGLAEYVRAAGDPKALAAWAAKYPDDPQAPAIADAPAVSAPALAARRLGRRVSSLGDATRWMLGVTAFNTFGAILLLLRVGPEPEGPASYAEFAGPLLSSAIFAVGLWRARALDLGRALFTILAGIVGYVVAVFTAPLVEPLMAVFGTDSDAARGFINGSLAGFGGAFVAAGGIALLIGGVGGDRWGRLLAACLGLGLVCGMLGTGMLHGLYGSNFFWISVVWTLGYGLILTWLATGRPAR
jgi:hypothetical protein